MAEKVDYKKAVELFNQYTAFQTSLEKIIEKEKSLKEDLKNDAKKYVDYQLGLELAKLPVESINRNHIGIPVNKLKTKYHNLNQVCSAGYIALTAIPGIGEKLASQIREESLLIRQETAKDIYMFISKDNENIFQESLLLHGQIYLSLQDIFKEAKLLSKKYPNHYEINVFNCLKNFFTYSLASQNDKNKANNQYIELLNLINGEYGKKIAEFVKIYQQHVELKTVAYSVYEQNKQVFDQLFNSIDPIHYRKDVIEQVNDDIDLISVKNTITSFRKKVDYLNDLVEEEKKTKEMIRKEVNTIRGLHLQNNYHLIPLNVFLDEKTIDLLENKGFHTFQSIEDAPLATLNSIKGIDGVALKRTAEKAKMELRNSPFHIEDHESLIRYLHILLLKQDYYKNAKKILLKHDEFVKSYQEDLNIYKSDKFYQVSSREEKMIAKRTLDELIELLENDFGIAIDSMMDSPISLKNARGHFKEHKEEYYTCINSIVPSAASKPKAEEKIKQEIVEKVIEKEDPIKTLIYDLYMSLNYQDKLQMIEKSGAYQRDIDVIKDSKAHIDSRINTFEKLINQGLFKKEELELFKLDLEETNDTTSYTDLEYVVRGKRNNVVNSLYETFQFRQINGLAGREANQFKIYFVDEDNRLISNEVIIEANKDEGTIYKERFEFISQSYDLNKVYKMIIKNKKGRIYQEYHFKFDISFADDFDF